MTEKFTWRASDEFTAALRNYRDERQNFIDAVVLPFDRDHPSNPTFWNYPVVSLDPTCIGFKDGAKDAPAGLSRAQSRAHLIPVRGVPGDYWRRAIARMQEYPKMDRVFKAHGVHVTAMTGNTLSTPGMFDDGNDFYLICKGDLAIDRTKHLVPIKMSEFYLAKERFEGIQPASGARP